MGEVERDLRHLDGICMVRDCESDVFCIVFCKSERIGCR